jgi:hypothetical protein
MAMLLRSQAMTVPHLQVYPLGAQFASARRRYDSLSALLLIIVITTLGQSVAHLGTSDRDYGDGGRRCR